VDEKGSVLLCCGGRGWNEGSTGRGSLPCLCFPNERPAGIEKRGGNTGEKEKESS